MVVCAKILILLILERGGGVSSDTADIVEGRSGRVEAWSIDQSKLIEMTKYKLNFHYSWTNSLTRN